jgi:hypothetical protein
MERKLFGGNIYSSAHKFPSIYITNNKEDLEHNVYNLEYFTKYIKLINDMSTICGEDIAKLFAEIFKIYNISEDGINHSTQDEMIISFCTEALAHLSLAMNQSGKLINLIEASFDPLSIRQQSNYEIEGKDYCFIVIVLNNLFHYYSTIINIVMQKRYLNTEFVRSISERLALILSYEFETMRRMFKVLECYKEAEPTKTFH